MRLYARPGVTLGLLGRDPVRLGAVATDARAAGAMVEEGSVDVRDRAAMTDFLEAFDGRYSVDLLIANAGVLDGRRADGTIEDADRARRVIEINLLGATDTLHAVLPGIRDRKRGHIALISSLAALSPVADAPAYSASKAGLLSYGLALREALVDEAVRVSVVCPGYVTSAMTDSHVGNHPGKISADKAASLIDAGIARNKAVIRFPFLLGFFASISLFMPELINRLATKGVRFHVAPRN